MPEQKKLWPLFLSFILLSVISVGYVAYLYDEINVRGYPTTADTIIGIILIVLVFELTRRVYGWVLPIVTGLFVTHLALGQYLPHGPFWHIPFDLKYIVGNLS
jgi:TRAP-type uncharacterized transport system fused permease subunit